MRLCSSLKQFRIGWPMLFVVGFSIATCAGLCAQNFTDLHDFNGTDGSQPYFMALAIGNDGNLYGTTEYGGAHNLGTVFSITPTGTLTTLHSFAGPPSDGATPTAGLTLGSDGNFYGTTLNGGANAIGSIFKITPQGTVTLLHSFVQSDGQAPYAGVVKDGSGNFYGTTSGGGASGNGTTYKLSSNGTYTVLHNFNAS